MRCCAGDEGFVALRSRPAEGGFKPVPCQNSRNGSELVFSVLVRLLSGTR